MWELEIAGISFFDVFYNFFIYSFLGWIYESTYVSIREKKWVNRGFLNGPIIPIYGSAATLLYIAFFNNHMVDITAAQSIPSVLLLFVTGMILASLLEFVTSWTMEKIFHAKWWDYSECFCNIQGRVCLKASLFWGLLSVVMAELIQPAMERLLNRLPRPVSEYAGYVIFALFAADFTVTVLATLQLDKLLGGMERLREELYEAVEGRKWHEVKSEFRERMEESRVAEYLELVKETTAKRTGEFREKLEETRDRIEANVEKLANVKEQINEKYEAAKDSLSESASKKMEESKQKREESYQSFLQKYHNNRSNFLQQHTYRRLMKAYPKMRVKQRMGALYDLRDSLNRRGSETKKETKKENKKENK